MKFFTDTYELEPSSNPEEPNDPLVKKMENEIKTLLEDNGYKVQEIYSEYYDGEIHSISLELDDKLIRVTHDDDGVPCIDICDSNGDTMYTSHPKSEVDLYDFVKNLG